MPRPLLVDTDSAPDHFAIRWAVDKLTRTYRRYAAENVVAPPEIFLHVPTPPDAADWAGLENVQFPAADDSFLLAASTDGARLLVWGSNPRGAVYGLLELADRLSHAQPRDIPLALAQPIIRSPKAALRSVARCFSSEIEDKPWFNDREGWRQYLDMLVANRFNRLSLTFGMPYNYPYQNGYLSDVYFHFAYPFLVSPSGYDVRVKELSETERRDNLEMLQFIGREAERRGLDFQLGLWTHGYDFDDVPNANYTVEGITRENHAPYCRDALHTLLEAVPQIGGVTLRVHIESGIAEASYDFWSEVLKGIAATGRPIEVDLHAKGVEPKLIDTALRSGLPVNISPKYLAEHMGLPYHQAAIRGEESPPEGSVPSDASFSEGSRRFLRYSYGDLLSRRRNYTVSFRIWPGTQRLLLWGDPAMAGGYGALSTIAGAKGVEICEPLSYKGRMGSGQPGGRFCYSDNTMIPRYDWQKYEIFYRIWGRKLHDSATEEAEWSRMLASRCGDAAQEAARALQGVGGVLNIVTQAYGPSACNHYYWPEIYENLSLINLPGLLPYGNDFKQPGRFGTASSFDPQLFSNPAQFAAEALEGRLSPRYTPLDVAAWLDARANAGTAAVAAGRRTSGAELPESRRIFVDVEILSGLARFFARKFRAGCAWELFLLTGDRDFCARAEAHYREAIDCWRALADLADRVYMPDLSCGPMLWLRGTWKSRLAAMERDLNDITAWWIDTRLPLTGAVEAREAARALLDNGPNVRAVAPDHRPPPGFIPGEPLTLTLGRGDDWTTPPRLHYRRLNQAESWRVSEMTSQPGGFAATIDGAYTGSDFDLQYYFSADTGTGCRLMPGLQDDLSNQPYFVLSEKGERSDG